MTYIPLEPNFESIVSEQINLPYRDETFLKVSFSDPKLEGYELIVIEDSVLSDSKSVIPKGKEGERLFTMISRFPRNILAEVNTHRVFGRNSASSRARSIKSTIKAVMENPYIPLFTKNQRGMSGIFLDEPNRQKAIATWLKARDNAVDGTLRLLLGELITTDDNVAHQYAELVDRYYDEVYSADVPDPLAPSVHKQNANRLLEPFMWHEAIITSNFWDNYLELRTDLKTAQPEIVAMSRLVDFALKNHTPKSTFLHLPFIAPEDKPTEFTSFADMRIVLMLSATHCAQVSYADKSTAVRNTANIAIGESLLSDKHYSPFEHIAFDRNVYLKHAKENNLPTKKKRLVSNLDKRWVQLRKLL